MKSAESPSQLLASLADPFTVQITPGQLLQKVRMDAAVRSLRESGAAIATIAQDCGYSDQSAFTRQFRQTTGFSPLEYRQALRPR